MTLTEILKAVINSEYGWSVAEQFEHTFNGSESFEDQNENALEYINDILEDILDSYDFTFSKSAIQEIFTYQEELQDYLKGKMADDDGMMAKGGMTKKLDWRLGKGFPAYYYGYNNGIYATQENNLTKDKKIIDLELVFQIKNRFINDKERNNFIMEMVEIFPELDKVEIIEAIHYKMADGGMMAKGGSVRSLLSQFQKEKPTILIQMIADDVSSEFMRKKFDETIVWSKLSDSQKEKYNEDFRENKSEFEKYLIYEFVKLYYSNDTIKNKCKGNSRATISAIKSVMVSLAKDYPTTKYAEGGMMASGGLFDSPQKRSANRGLSWTLDHKRHNKGESYEIPLNKRKRKY